MRYPAISPNGGTIAFSYKGNLYKVPATGGTATVLTINPAYDYMPVWSPDGQTIAFASNRYGNFDVFVMPAGGGEPQRLTFHSNNEYPSAFSPDGKEVIFNAVIQDNYRNVMFPDDMLSELYAVPVAGGGIRQILTTPAESAVYSADGRCIAYHDRKGYEDPWRKHHQSAVTRDIWVYDVSTGKHTKVTRFAGEDRNPLIASDSKSILYLTETWGSFNVASIDITGVGEPKKLSHFEKHPVRFLTKSGNDLLCYQYNGEIYTQRLDGAPQKVGITILADQTETAIKYESISRGATEMAISPDGKEVAFIVRGDVFVTSADYSTTKRITRTPDQERSVSFSPTGRSCYTHRNATAAGTYTNRPLFPKMSPALRSRPSPGRSPFSRSPRRPSSPCIRPMARR
jgi:Tol biopolymer transport system component